MWECVNDKIPETSSGKDSLTFMLETLRMAKRGQKCSFVIQLSLA